MQRLVWQNLNGDEINLTSGNYGITNWEGFANTSLNIQSQQVPFQDGGVFLDALMEQRELSVTLKMYDGGNLETRYRLRRELMHILNPKLGEGYLIYTNDFISKRIKCVAQIPLFETHNSNDSGTPKASLAWTACGPYWEDLEETEIIINNVSAKNVVNNGDVETGVKIEIYPLYDTVEKPYFFNITQNKKIEYDKQIGNIPLLINTNIGKKEVYKEALNRNEMFYANINNLEEDIIYSDYYRKFYCINENGVIESSVDGVRWTEVMTTNYKKMYIYSNIVILYQNNLSETEGDKIKISLDFENFSEYSITVPRYEGDENIKLLCYQPNIEYQTYYICIKDTADQTFFSYFSVSGNTIENFHTTFTQKNLTTGNSLLLIVNENLKALFAITSYDCYKYQNEQWEKVSEDIIYPYLPFGKYIRENNIMVCYGTTYGYIYWSTDGVKWNFSENSVFNNIRDITFDAEKHRYLAVGQYQDYYAHQKVLIAESKDFIHWEKIEGLEDLQESRIEQIITDGNGKYVMHIYWVGYEYNIAVSDLKTFQNEISNITKESDLSLSLAVGDNHILISDKTMCKVKYRQKYIGV